MGIFGLLLIVGMDIRGYITIDQIKMIYELQVINTKFIEIGMNYQDRKKLLSVMYQKDVSILTNPYIESITA